MADPYADEPLLPPLELFPLEQSLELQLLRHLNVTLLPLAAANGSANLNDSYEYSVFESCQSVNNPLGHLLNFVLYMLVCIVGLFGNTLVIYVVLRYSKMQTITNVYILNLAIADECFLIGIPFLLQTINSGSWQFGDFMCKAYMVSTSITQFTSSIFLLIMSADRYIAVCHPITSPRYRTPLISKLVSLCAWLTSVLLMLPVIIFASTVQNGEHISCHIKWPEAAHMQTGFTFILYTFTLGFATPLCFILCFYYLVIRKLRTVGPQHKSKERKRSHRKVTKLVLTVITVYILCWLPFWLAQLVLITTTPSKCATRLEITMFLLVGCLAYSNSAMNPFLYAFLSENFKKSFRKAFTCIMTPSGRECATASGTAAAAGAAAGATSELQTTDTSVFSKWGKRGRKFAAAAAARQQRQQKRNELLGACDSNTTTLLTTTTNTTYGTGNAATTTTTGGETLSKASPTEIANANFAAVAAAATATATATGNVTANGGRGFKSDSTDMRHANECDGVLRPPVLHTDL